MQVTDGRRPSAEHRAGPAATAVDRAWAQSLLARFPAPVGAVLRSNGTVRDYPARSVAWQEHASSGRAMLGLVVSGLVRIFVMSPQGRQVTVRYDREGDLIGLTAVLAGGATAGVVAVTDARLFLLPVDLFRTIVRREPAVSYLVAQDLAQSLLRGQEMLAENVFGSVRARIARHLLDLATPDDRGMLVLQSQQDIADSIGSVREVVSRVLGSLREDGLIARAPLGLRLVDIDGLRRLALLCAQDPPA